MLLVARASDMFYDDNGKRFPVLKGLLTSLLEITRSEPAEEAEIRSYIDKGELRNERDFRRILSTLPGPLPEKSLAQLRPDLAREWLVERNRPLTPEMFSLYSQRRVWWKCAEDHEWLSTVGHRSRGSGCPYCAGLRASKTHNLLVLNPDLARQWHPEKNGNLTPDQLPPRSGKRVWWICGKGHEWQAPVHDMTGCPYCAGQRVGEDNNLASRFPDVAKEWNHVRNGDLRPRDVTPGSHRKVWWICLRGHEWAATVKARARGSKCPKCYNENRSAIQREARLRVRAEDKAQHNLDGWNSPKM